MDLRKLKTLIDLVSESNISELEITEADGKVRIVKASAGDAMAMAPMMHAPPAAPAAMHRRRCDASRTCRRGGSAPPVASGHVVKSPMVGTFYRSSSPGAQASSPKSASRSRKASRSASSRR